MDHHCVWINNCMGSRNYKFFIGFLSTAWVHATQPGGYMYVYLVLQYCLGVVNGAPVPDYLGTWQLKVVFYVIITFQMPFSILVTLLILQHHIFVLNNVTTLETYKGQKLGWVPGYYYNEADESPFDLGVIANYLQVYGQDFMWWLCPTVPENLECEVEFPQTPELTVAELELYKDLIVQTVAPTPEPEPPKPALPRRPHPLKSQKSTR